MEMREEIVHQIEYIHQRIENRRQVLLEDERTHQIVENRVLSSNMAKIPGMEQHLRHAQLAKENSSSNEIKDMWSHASFSRGEVQQKYNTPRRFNT